MFFPFHFRTCFSGCFVLCFFIEFSTFDLQNDASYVCKTYSCLKLPLLKQLEKSMISGSLLALFCHHFLCFPMIDFCMFSGMFFCDLFLTSVFKWLPKASAADPLSASFFDTCSTLFRKGVIEGSFVVLVPFWFHVSWFWMPFRFHFGIENLSFGHSNL